MLDYSIGYIGRTSTLWITRRQRSIATNTYSAEFMALHTAIKEAIYLQYMLRCLGLSIASGGFASTRIFGDNLSVIQNETNDDLCLSKKHGAISYHSVCEVITAGFISPFWLKGKFNQNDAITKKIAAKEFLTHVENIFWSVPHHNYLFNYFIILFLSVYIIHQYDYFHMSNNIDM